MTKYDDIIYIDEDTYYQITGEKDYNSYVEFLNNNKKFVDVTKQRKTIFDDKILKSDNIEIEKQKVQINAESLEEKHKQADDLRFFPSLIWLEMYLPRYELVYGCFNYSKEILTNKQKCEELLEYYGNICGITDIKDIFKKKPHKGFYR